MPNVSNVPMTVMDILVSLTRDLSSLALDQLVLRVYLSWLIENPYAPMEECEEVISRVNSRLRKLYQQQRQIQ